jgi:hypothetical protein
MELTARNALIAQLGIYKEEMTQLGNQIRSVNDAARKEMEELVVKQDRIRHGYDLLKDYLDFQAGGDEQ